MSLASGDQTIVEDMKIMHCHGTSLRKKLPAIDELFIAANP